MQMPRMWTIFICLIGATVTGQSLNFWHDVNGYWESSSERPELETAAIHPSATDAGAAFLDAHVPAESVPSEESEGARVQMESEEERGQQRVEVRKLTPGRRGRRGAGGKRKHAATVEANAYRIAGLGKPLMGWGKRGRAGEESSSLMAVLKELHAEKRRLMDQGKPQEEEEADDDDDDDDDDDEDDDDDDEDDDDDDNDDDDDEAEEEEDDEAEEENEEAGEEEEEEEGAEEEEEEQEEGEAEEEATETPSNHTDTNGNFTESLLDKCQTAEGEISCRGIGVTHLPIIHNAGVTKLDIAENNIESIAPQDFSGLPNLDTLDLSKNKLDDESFGQNPLSSLAFLKKLNIDGNGLTKIPPLPPSLEELKMSNNKLTALTPHCFKGLTNLLNLELEANTLHEASVSPLAFRPLERLLHLQLDNNHFHSLPLGLPPSLQNLKMNENVIEEVLEEALRNCVHLRVLDLKHNLLHEQGIATHGWTRLKSLEVLDLSYNHLTSVPMNLPRPLRRLTLRHNNISHIPAFTFRHLRPGLQSLHLSHNALRDEGIEQLSFAGTYRSLVELLLDNNHLGEVPRCVRQLKNLQVLRLDNNQIRLVRRWAVCHPQNPVTTLTSVHLENNLLQVEKIPTSAFSCLTAAEGLVLHPQQGHSHNE